MKAALHKQIKDGSLPPALPSLDQGKAELSLHSHLFTLLLTLTLSLSHQRSPPADWPNYFSPLSVQCNLSSTGLYAFLYAFAEVPISSTL